MRRTTRAATRGSALALWQTNAVAAMVAADVEPVVVKTEGDRRADVPIHEIGGKGVFVKEVQAAVLDGRADFAVHSAKDLPAVGAEGLVIASVPRRADARDALVGADLDGLEEGAVVGTGSIRRRAQLAAHRPDLRFRELRGNVDTRLTKLANGDYDAIVMAAAAIDRLELTADVIDRLAPSVMLPQVGQGSLAIECRADDDAMLELLTPIEHEPSRSALEAERAFLAELGGDCDLPAGAYAVLADDELSIEALLASEDGTSVLRATRAGAAAHGPTLGRDLARHLLDECGGSDLLGEI